MYHNKQFTNFMVQYGLRGFRRTAGDLLVTYWQAWAPPSSVHLAHLRASSSPPAAAMAPPSRQRALAVGDTVSVALRHFGREYAQNVAGSQWASEKQRCTGMVVDKDGDAWLVEFEDMEEPVKLKRSLLHFEAREDVPARPGERGAALDADSSAEEEAAEQPRQRPRKQPRRAAASRSRRAAAARTVADISDTSDDGSELSCDADGSDVQQEEEEEWSRDDHFAMDERARQGHQSFCQPSFNMHDYANASFFSLCMYWLSAGMALSDADGEPPLFLEVMAAAMQAAGRAKATGPSDRWAQWCVSYQDLIQWIGTWYYMLAFPQPGNREAYFRPPSFGPTHNLAAVLARGENGNRGLRWFIQMHACFTMPTGTVAEDDPFLPVACMWESFRVHLTKAVTPGTLLLLDESMVKWVGRNMPGLMVVQRKPTPMGAELHTLCCAHSGIMVNYELYEGKARMEKKEFTNVHPKHVALTLRCLKPYFGTVSPPCVHVLPLPL